MLTGPRLLRTTAFRLSLLYAVLYSLLMAAALGFTYWATISYIQHDMDAELKAESDGLVQIFDRQGLSGLERSLKRRSAPALLFARNYLLLGPDGARLAGNLPAWPAGLGPDTWGTFRAPTANGSRADDPGDPHFARARTVTLAGGYRLLVGQSLDGVHEVREHIFGVVAAAVGVTVVLALALGVLMGRSVLSRIDAVSRTAGEIMAGDLTRRLPVGARNDEFDELAARLNAMLARIEQLMVAMRQVTDNVAHDLRSPLSRIRNQLELTLLEPHTPEQYRGAVEKAIRDADDLMRTFNALLSIAQAEAGVRRNDWASVDLGALARDLAELYEAAAEERELALHVKAPAPVRIRGNRELLAQAVSNLLDNAIKYTPPGGAVTVQVRAGDDGGAELAVSDTGPGIPPEAREQVTERFVRLDPARSTSGNGLGLSLVKAVAGLHGGRLVLEDSGPGLRARVCFGGA